MQLPSPLRSCTFRALLTPLAMLSSFQIGLAILKINGEALLEVTDDGMFIK